jgi:SAM-dependent methyltransferase
MHIEAVAFSLFVKGLFPESFQGKNVLDVGSGDINGNNRTLFVDCSYIGNDVYSGRNVTIVSKTSALPFEDETFDTIISTECFEHDPEYEASFRKIVKLLKPGGLFVFTCASTGRAEHGTRRTSPQDSFGTVGNIEGWTDYYKNLTFDDFDAAVNVRDVFSQFQSYYNRSACDLYFWGIKRGEAPVKNTYPIYQYAHVNLVTSS